MLFKKIICSSLLTLFFLYPFSAKSIEKSSLTNSTDYLSCALFMNAVSRLPNTRAHHLWQEAKFKIAKIREMMYKGLINPAFRLWIRGYSKAQIDILYNEGLLQAFDDSYEFLPWLELFGFTFHDIKLLIKRNYVFEAIALYKDGFSKTDIVYFARHHMLRQIYTLKRRENFPEDQAGILPRYRTRKKIKFSIHMVRDSQPDRSITDAQVIYAIQNGSVIYQRIRHKGDYRRDPSQKIACEIDGKFLVVIVSLCFKSHVPNFRHATKVVTAYWEENVAQLNSNVHLSQR